MSCDIIITGVEIEREADSWGVWDAIKKEKHYAPTRQLAEMIATSIIKKRVEKEKRKNAKRVQSKFLPFDIPNNNTGSLPRCKGDAPNKGDKELPG